MYIVELKVGWYRHQAGIMIMLDWDNNTPQVEESGSGHTDNAYKGSSLGLGYMFSCRNEYTHPISTLFLMVLGTGGSSAVDGSPETSVPPPRGGGGLA